MTTATFRCQQDLSHANCLPHRNGKKMAYIVTQRQTSGAATISKRCLGGKKNKKKTERHEYTAAVGDQGNQVKQSGLRHAGKLLIYGVKVVHH